MEMTTNAISWFEIPVSDFDRAKEFYGTIFDFDMPVMDMGPTRMGFLLSEQGVGVGGAIVHGEGAVPSSTGSLVYLNGGADLSVVLGRVTGAGGSIIVPKTDIGSGFGNFALFIDTEGNKVGLHSMG
jgi:predicted enzyme related to lactoylglutathione lyase